MKKIVKITSLIALVLGCVYLVGCKKTTTVDPAIAALEADFASLKAAYKSKTYSSNVTLPQTLEEGSTVTWVSSDTSIVGNDGTIVKFFEFDDTTGDLVPLKAKLTGTVKNGENVKTHEFEVTVKAPEEAETISKAIKALYTTYEGVALSGYGVKDSKMYKEFVTRADCTFTYTSTDHLEFHYDEEKSLWYAFVSPEADTDSTDMVKIAIKAGEYTHEVTIPVIIPKDETVRTNIAGVLADLKAENTKKADGSDKEYQFSGTIVKMYEYREKDKTSGYQGFWMWDGETSFYVYGTGTGENVALGDEVLLTATVTIYSGLYETSKVSALQVITPAKDNTEKFNAYQNAVVTPELFKDKAAMDLLQAEITTIQAIFVSGSMKDNTSASLIFAFIDDPETTFTVRVDKYSTEFSQIKDKVNAIALNTPVELEVAVSRYLTDPQFSLALAEDISVFDGELTKKQKAAIDFISFPSIAKNVVPNQEIALPASGTQYETTIKYELNVPEGMAEFASITDGKIVFGNFSQTFEVTLTVTFEYIYNLKKQTLVKTFDIIAEVPSISLTEAMALETVAPNTVITFEVVDILGTRAVVRDGEFVAVITLAEGAMAKTSITGPSHVKAVLSSFIKDSISAEGVDALITISNVISADKTDFTEGDIIQVSEVTAVIKKVQLKNITIASGAATQDEATVKFYTDFTCTTPLADGTYYALHGYSSANGSDTVVVVTTVVAGINEAIQATAGERVTVAGLVVAITNTGTTTIIDENGNIIDCYLGSKANTTDLFGKYVVYNGLTGENYSIKQVNCSTASDSYYVVSNPKTVITTETIVAAVEESHVVTAIAGKPLTGVAGYRTLYTITGAQLVDITVTSGKPETTVKVTIDGQDAFMKFNGYFGAEDELNLEIAKLNAIKDDVANYTLSFTIIENFYDNKGDYFQLFVIPGTLVVTPIA